MCMTDEMAEIQRRMAELETERDSLRQALVLAQCDQRDLFFAHILGGEYFDSEQALHSVGASVGVDFPYASYIVLSIQAEAWGELFQSGGMDRRDLNFILRNTVENGFPGKTHAADVQGKMVAIINLEQLPETGFGGIVQDASHMLEVLETEFGITITVAISQVYHSPLQLPHAMRDVNLIFESPG